MSDPVQNPMAACPTPIFPTVAAWQYNNSLPRITQEQIEFHNWTAHMVIQQCLLSGDKDCGK